MSLPRPSDVLVLCYHAVSRTWSSPYAVTPELLAEQLSSLLRRGYRGATFAQALSAPPARRTVAVTFDDGYRSVVEHGLPVLERLGVPATIFACTGFVGSDAPMPLGLDDAFGGAPDEELVSASWEDLRQLAVAGWEVGSHTHSHPHLTSLADGELAAELTDSRAECEERLGAPCVSIAYPFGDVDSRVVEAAKAAGYRHGGGVLGVSSARESYAWPRVRVARHDTRLRFGLKASRPLRRLRGSAAWAPLHLLHVAARRGRAWGA